MSIRFRVRVVNHGVTLEETRETSEELTVGELIAELSRAGFIPFSQSNVVVAVVRGSVIGENHTVGELFGAVAEPERLIDFWLVAPELRDLLETLAAAREEEDLDADEDFDEDEGFGTLAEEAERQAPLPEAAPPPAPPMLPAPAPGSPAPPASMPKPQMEPPPPRPRRRAEPRIEEDEPRPRMKSKSRMRLPTGGMMRGDSSESILLPEGVASRRASVRFYDRMNPQKVFPFMVTLTAEKLKKILQKGVAQTESKPFEVKLEEMLTVEPILPGCTCYPAKAEMKITAADTAVHFWVVPQVLGKVKGAKVCISQEGRTLTEVELSIKVRRTTVAIVLGLVTLLYPFAAAFAKQFGIDFKNLGMLGEYLSVANEYLRIVSPLAIFGGLILVTGFLYWWSRPRERDQFWDLDTEPGKR